MLLLLMQVSLADMTLFNLEACCALYTGELTGFAETWRPGQVALMRNVCTFKHFTN